MLKQNEAGFLPTPKMVRLESVDAVRSKDNRRTLMFLANSDEKTKQVDQKV